MLFWKGGHIVYAYATLPETEGLSGWLMVRHLVTGKKLYQLLVADGLVPIWWSRHKSVELRSLHIHLNRDVSKSLTIIVSKVHMLKWKYRFNSLAPGRS